MKEKTGSFRFHIESYVCDFMGKATLPVLGNFMLQAATIHAQERGFGFDDLQKDNAAWVLSRISIRIEEYPNHDETITVETWVEDVSRSFTQRCFSFIDSQGRVFGDARSIWAAIDIRTRRPMDIPSWRPDLADYIVPDKVCLAEKPAKIPAVLGVEASMGYTVRYSDIDINKHMNSIKYIEHILNTFDLETFRTKIIHKFEIVFLTEGTFGEKLKLYKQELPGNEVLVDTRNGEDSVCRSRIVWK